MTLLFVYVVTDSARQALDDAVMTLLFVCVVTADSARQALDDSVMTLLFVCVVTDSARQALDDAGGVTMVCACLQRHTTTPGESGRRLRRVLCGLLLNLTNSNGTLLATTEYRGWGGICFCIFTIA